MHGINIIAEADIGMGDILSNSGVRMNKYFVLTHGCIIWPLIEDYISKNKIYTRIIDASRLESSLNAVIMDTDVTFTVHISSYDKPFDDHESLDIEQSCFSEHRNRYEKKCLTASLERILIPPQLYGSLYQVLSKDDWEFTVKDTETNLSKSRASENLALQSKFVKNASKNALYLSTLLLLKIGKEGNIQNCVSEFKKFAADPRKGQYIYLQGNPFGRSAPLLLLDSITQGIISSIEPDGNFFITDARCTIGCEGGPAYSNDSRLMICGIVLSPHCSLMGHWVGLTFVASIKPVLQYIKFAVHGKSTSEGTVAANKGVYTSDSSVTAVVWPVNELYHRAKSFILSRVVSLMEVCVVRVSIPNLRNRISWGSGVIVNAEAGIIISCSHVVKDSVDKTVEICFSDGSERSAAILFHTSIELKGPKSCHYSKHTSNAWDIAVIQLEEPARYELPLAKELPLVGTAVLNGGHALFWKDTIVSPTFSLGNLAQIVELPRRHFVCENLVIYPVNSAHNQPYDISTPDNTKITEELSYCKLHTQDLICHKWKVYDDESSSYPAMIQTSCAVYNGLSGGPVVAIHPTKGPLVIGIVTSCVQSKNVDILFPHINMAVPSYFISKAVDNYIISKDPKAFEMLNIQSAEAQRVCIFEHALSAKL